MPVAQKGQRFGGRQKGTPNKVSGSLKESILEAAMAAGGGKPDGLINYLKSQATLAPAPFMGLLGKIIPLTLAGDPDHPIMTSHAVTFVSKGSKDA